MTQSSVFSPFTLPCGRVLKNRIVKAAMEENLATAEQTPGAQLRTLYQSWAQGGAGLLITGNVMVDRLAMTGPAGVVLENEAHLNDFKRWAKAAQTHDAQIWMQINHPGRQVFAKLGGKSVSPSDVAIDIGKHSALFVRPKPLTESEILDVIARFVNTAKLAEKAGFDGVQIHGAHGYLLAQFLSPLTNKRNDKWGGTLENRARILIEIIKGVREQVGPSFAVAVKLNSADFQRGGFDIDDAEQVVAMLHGLGVDVVELSGGSYESPAMQGRTADQRTLAREAYFIDFAKRIAEKSAIPIMTTGGVTRLATAEMVLSHQVELVGLARALAFNPSLPNQWLKTPALEGSIPQVHWKDKTMGALAVMAIIKRNLRRLSRNKVPAGGLSPIWTLLIDQFRTHRLTKRYRKRILLEKR
ncbi:NADH:flavin oxidoreductase/NADH oxidase family protein [Alteromonas sp. a30]|uniref:NADH:flavin oxidoreductase/NADH oxidase family protein n=1 Tax=Alteromonas sp. a30 TaxID=2730917 RepID=UPI00227FB57D|nr:NADH:flavin oxidoreductase/NADH oxidase family protein [Alteromonas sp. a30]MCY7295615.1 NADH:flavin oxidoreductase/NADH oxidase family protein [Alteromonas sp. a30]